MGEDMKQVLVCRNCNVYLSKPVAIVSSDSQNSQDPKFDFFETCVADQGVAFKSSVHLFNAEKAVSVLRDEFNQSRSLWKKFADFFKSKHTKYLQRPNFPLCAIEEKAMKIDAAEIPIGLSHLTFTPQFWMHFRDWSNEIEWNDEITWGWTGNNKPNIYCANCDSAIGTAIAYLRISEAFIPDPTATYWQAAN